MKRPLRLASIVCAFLLGSPLAAQNLLSNAEFATDLSGWEPLAGTVSWHPLDLFGSASSGSVRLLPPETEGETSASIVQCVEVEGGAGHVFSAGVFRNGGDAVSAFGGLSWYADTDCTVFLEQETPITLLQPGVGVWQLADNTVEAPAAAQSALVVLRARRESEIAAPVHFDHVILAPDLGCVDTPNLLCLNDGRFRVSVGYRRPNGVTGGGTAVKLTDDTGYFWFFDSSNVEVVIKVLDACATGFHSYWVFAAGLTNVEVTITVFDTESEQQKVYVNPLDRPFEAIQDTSAFETCP